MRVHTHALADLFSQHTGAAGGAVVRSDCTLLVTSLKNMYCAIRQLEVTFSVSAGLTHHSFSHIKSNHLFLFFSAPPIHPSPRRSALLDLIREVIADLSPFSDVTRRLLHQHRLSLSFLSCFFILYHFLSPLLLLFFTLSSHLPFRRPAIHLSNTLQSSLSLSLPHLAILLHLHLPPPLLHFSSLLSSAPYCSINLSDRRSISAPRLLFFPSLSAPLFSLSSTSPGLL